MAKCPPSSALSLLISRMGTHTAPVELMTGEQAEVIQGPPEGSLRPTGWGAGRDLQEGRRCLFLSLIQKLRVVISGGLRLGWEKGRPFFLFPV